MTFRPALVAVVVLLGATHAPGAGSSSFPCRWNYTFFVGLMPGKVIAGENANCAGVRGTLELDASLYESTSTHVAWRLVRHLKRSWTNPSGNRYVEIRYPCALGRAKAVFVWTFRSGSKIVARNRVATSPLADPGPACKLTLR